MRIPRSKRPIRHAIGVLLLASMVVLLAPRRAEAALPQSGVVKPAALPEPVFLDTVSGFELYQNGIFWWSTLGPNGCPGGEFNNVASIKLRGIFSATTRILENKRCPILQDSDSNVVRDSQYVYYFQDKQLVRKAVNAAASYPPTPLTNAPKLTSLSSDETLAIDSAGRLYWSTFSNGLLRIWRMKADNSETPTVFTTISSANGNVDRIVTYHYGSFNGEVDGIALTENGNLWRYTTESGGPAQLLGSNIRDFWVHLSPGAFGTTVVRFYAAQGGSLLRITPSGTSTTLYPAKPSPGPGQYFSVDGVTVDDVNIYISEGFYDCSGGGFCSPDPTNRAMYRRALGAAGNASWDLIVAQGGGVNLRSDGQFLYFITDYSSGTNSGIAIKKVATDAPPVQIDIEALDLEVTQAIQNLKEGFDLVAGHPTVVRGYARVATSTDATAYQINATLTGKLNGQLLPGGPLHPIKSIKVDATTTKQAMRDGANLAFLFVLPESWVKDVLPLVPDQLTLEMTVNPAGDPPENVGATPLANNKVSATALVRVAAHPCLLTIPVRDDGMPVPVYNPPSLPQKIARARALMPLSDFRVFSLDTILSKDGGDYDMDKDNTDPTDDSDDGALNDLNALDDLAPLPWQTCSSIHWVGMLHPDSPAWFGGVAYLNDNVLLAKMNSGAGWTLAHELGHNYGRQHINCGVFPPGQDNFDVPPYDPCHLYFTDLPLEEEYYGLDFLDLNHVQVKRPQDHPDLMSYASNRWVSFLYWSTLMDIIPHFNQGIPLTAMAWQAQSTQIGTPAAGELLYVGGELNLDADAASFHTVYRLPDGIAPAAKVAQSLRAEQTAAQAATYFDPAAQPQHSDGSVVIRQLDASNTTLGETPVMAKENTLHSGAQHRYGFGQYIPFNPQTKKVQLVHGNLVLAERVASAHAPTLTLATPVLDNAAGTIALSWSAGDGDGDALHAMILYSNDDGAHWLPLGKNVTGLEAKFSTQGLAGGTKARMRLIVDDGFNTAVATSSPFVINKHAPTPVIDGIVEQQRLPYAATTTLYGLALDADQGSLDGEALTWSLSGPSSQSYSGTQVILAGLAPGQYSLTLSAKDSDGMTGATTRHFEVLPVPVPSGNAPRLDGRCSDAVYANAVVVPLDQHGTQASLIHSGSILYACFSGLQLGANSATNVVGMRVDANNSKGATAQSDDRGFFVDEDGIPFQTVGNGSDMPVTLSPAPGYAATVAYNNTGWSAEMSIADALVGGWGHLAGVMFQYGVASPSNNANNWPHSGIYNKPDTWATALFGAALTLNNRAPVANAGGDQIYALSKPMIIALDSSASYDADLDTITQTWRQTAGPSVLLTDPTTSTIRFTASPVSVPTVLRFQLTVSDGKLSSSPDEVEITLLPAKPSMTDTNRKQVYLPLVMR